MASWKKLINSGSNAHVESLEILSPPTLSPSLKVDGGVFFHNLPDQDDLPGGTLMKINDGGGSSVFDGVGSSKFVIISNTPIEEEEEEEEYNIPWNEANFDVSGDGEVSVNALLGFLIAYGEAEGDVSYDFNFDTNGDNEVGSADLLELLIAYGSTLEELAGNMNVDGTLDDHDGRPSVDWNSSDFAWVNSEGYVTADSVQSYYNTFTDKLDFWEKLGYDPTDPTGAGSSGSVYKYIFNSNPPGEGLILDDNDGILWIEIFKYIYFTQITYGVYGGNTYYNRNGVQTTGNLSDSFPPDGVTPIGYGPYSRLNITLIGNSNIQSGEAHVFNQYVILIHLIDQNDINHTDYFEALVALDSGWGNYSLTDGVNTAVYEIINVTAYTPDNNIAYLITGNSLNGIKINNLNDGAATYLYPVII